MEGEMIFLGVLLLILGFVFAIKVLLIVGFILVVLGAIFAFTHTGPFNGRWY
jgi:hypothetical protein